MKLKFTLASIIGLITLNFAWAQPEYHCSRVKGHSHADNRSARLSDHYIALTEEYDVHFYKLDIELERTATDISGSTEIHVKVLAPILDTFLFELYDDFFIDDIFMNGVTPIPYTREESAVIVPVAFEAGDEFFVRVEYEGTPPDGDGPLGGGGMTNGFSPSWGNQVTWSLSEPFAAYEWFACKQSLTDKADSSKVWVTTDASNMAGSNGILQNVTELPGGKERYEWASNYPIDYYLISVAVADYQEYNVYANPPGVDPILIQNFVYDSPGLIGFFGDDIDETADFLELYSELYGLYPFAGEKYGHSMAPIGGGMEHQTMTTQGYFVNWLTAHELGHQWFGNNVTCASWADIWVNEGFASYSEELMMEAFYPGDEVGSMASRHENIMDVPGGSVWVEDSTNSGRIFNGRLTYDKGAAIVHTLRFLIDDDDLFFQTLQDFQTMYSGGTATGLDFKAVAESVTGMDFTNFFNEWYFGEGFPEYTIEYVRVGDELIVSLQQETSMPGVTPYFTNDVEIRINRSGALPEIVRLTAIDGASTIHVIPLDGDGDVSAIFVDPSNWIINRFGGATENNNLAALAQVEIDIEIYPNPAMNLLIIEQYSDVPNYIITTADGKLVQQGTVQRGKTTIDVSTLALGNYFVQMGQTKKAFVKQ